MVVRKKGMMIVELMVIVVLAVIVLAVLIGIIILGGQQPTSDLAKQTLVRSCCQLNMPLSCSNTQNVNCIVSKELEAGFDCTPIDGSPCKKTLVEIAGKVGISDVSGVKTFCGCG
ncbi:MAG: hypothetical protein HYT71_01425 [Candidatus Aenigmarchaeota archaeon]|nr:hypothetical protein [Candidatus Aenigmarchaeota archaeon]